MKKMTFASVKLFSFSLLVLGTILISFTTKNEKDFNISNDADNSLTVTPFDNKYIKIENGHSGKALCTMNNSGDAKSKNNQEKIIQYDFYNDATQIWFVKPLGGNLYALQNAHSGKALCTMNNSKDAKSKNNQEAIIQYDYYGDATQKWKFQDAGNGKWFLINAHSGKALCTMNWSKDAKSKKNQEAIIQYDAYGDATQKWKMTVVNKPTPSATQTNSNSLTYGKVYHLQNGYLNYTAGYLDICGYTTCESKKYSVSVGSNPDRSSGSGSWKITSASGKKDGDPVQSGDKIYIIGMYDGGKGGYLDGCGREECGGSVFDVSTHIYGNRNNAPTATWVIKADKSGTINNQQQIWLQNVHTGHWLQTGCHDRCGGNTYNVNLYKSQNREANVTHWRMIPAQAAPTPTTKSESGFRVLINGLYCLQSADGGNGTDEPYFEVFVDGSSTPIKFGSRPMNESNRSLWEQFTDGVESLTRTAQQEFWLMPGSVYAENKVVIKLWEEDDGRGSSPFVNNDDYIGEIVITKSTPDNNYILKEFRSAEEGNWNIAYSKHTRTKFDPSVEGEFRAINVRVPVLNQGSEGACVAFATVGALTTTYLNKTKPGTSREELFDPFALYDKRNKSQYPDGGWNIAPCLNWIMNNGIPFKNDPSKKLVIKTYYEYHKDGRVFEVRKTGGRKRIAAADNNGYNKMRAVLKSGQPLIVGYDVYPDFMAYAGVQGVYGGKIANVNSESAHAVFVVGYNNPALKSNASPTWILQNSWKPTWGKNGLCFFAEGACNFDNVMYKIGDFEVVPN